MGCLISSLRHARSQPPRQQNGSPLRNIPPCQNIVLLLLGPIGSEITSFVQLATQQVPSTLQTLQGPASFSEDDIRTFRTSIPGSPKPLILIVPPLIDGDTITERDVIDGTRSWLDRNGDYPYIDYILYFPEVGKRYQIQLTPVSSYLSSLESLCGISDRRKLCSRILVVGMAPAEPDMDGLEENRLFQVPKAWAFLEANGSRRFVLEGETVEPVQSILRDLATQGDLD